MEYPNLKKRIQANRISDFIKGDYKPWSMENIADGFKKFYEDNTRYPTAEEIDKYQYLPTSRQIQRTYGGLISLREKLGLKIHNFGAGQSRTTISKEINQRASLQERLIEAELVAHFGEHFVHVERLVKKGKIRLDFFIYARDQSFGIDVFYPKDLSSLKKIINIKQNKYEGLKFDIYLVNLNDTSELLNTAALQRISLRKDKQLTTNLLLMNKLSFLNLIKLISPFGGPLG